MIRNALKIFANNTLHHVIFLLFSISNIFTENSNPSLRVLQNRSLIDYMKPETVTSVRRIKSEAHRRFQNRLEAVNNFCAEKRYKIPKLELNNDLNKTTSRWRQEIWWNIQKGFAWCCVYKVASSTLVTHMINIAGWNWDEYLHHLEDIGIERKRWRDYMIEELYPLPSKAQIL